MDQIQKNIDHNQGITCIHLALSIPKSVVAFVIVVLWSVLFIRGDALSYLICLAAFGFLGAQVGFMLLHHRRLHSPPSCKPIGLCILIGDLGAISYYGIITLNTMGAYEDWLHGAKGSEVSDEEGLGIYFGVINGVAAFFHLFSAVLAVVDIMLTCQLARLKKAENKTQDVEKEGEALPR